jgi:hypothetical protein
MCHGYHPEWDSARKTDYSDEEEDSPSFLAEESSTDTELLTDGGDEDEDEE